MNVTESTPKVSATIQGVALAVYAPYAEGHVLTPNEAAALNQVFAENVRNNFASTIKSRSEKSEPIDADTLQPMLDEYMKGYEFGVRRSGGVTLDPVEREAHDMIAKAVRDAIRKKGLALKDVPKEDIEARVAAVLADPEKGALMRKKAEAVVKARKQAAAEELGIQF